MKTADRTPEPRDSNAILNGLRVVLIEDNVIAALQTRRILKQAAAETVGIAGNGADGVRLALQHNPDLILMDIQLPTLDGFTAAEKILSHGPVCIVMVTGCDDQASRRKALRVGASGFVHKPFDGSVLLPALAEAYRSFISRAAA